VVKEPLNTSFPAVPATTFMANMGFVATRLDDPVLREYEVPLQFAAAPGHGDDATPAALGWARLAGAGLHSTVSRRQKTLQVAIGAVPTTTSLHLLVDSTGIKMLGERVMARDFDRQVAELQVRTAVLNRFTRLDTPITVSVL
jgi:hypothetical protein